MQTGPAQHPLHAWPEHHAVLGRFSRGSTAAQGGSGLGLALVAQQAALHRGSITLSDGPLGGLRATLTVSAAVEKSDPGAPAEYE